MKKYIPRVFIFALTVLLCTVVSAEESETAIVSETIGGNIGSGWEVCNTSELDNIYVAFVTYQNGEWIKRGWLDVRKGVCKNVLPKLTSRYVYYYAKGGKKTWEGTKRFCANPDEIFSWAGSGECPSGLKLFKFIRVDTKDFTEYTTRLGS